MAHCPQPSHAPSAYADSVARLAGIRNALRRGDDCGSGPAPDLAMGAAAAGLEGLAALREQIATAEASREMVDRIRRELDEISRLVLR